MLFEFFLLEFLFKVGVPRNSFHLKEVPRILLNFSRNVHVFFITLYSCRVILLHERRIRERTALCLASWKRETCIAVANSRNCRVVIHSREFPYKGSESWGSPRGNEWKWSLLNCTLALRRKSIFLPLSRISKQHYSPCLALFLLIIDNKEFS